MKMRAFAESQAGTKGLNQIVKEQILPSFYRFSEFYQKLKRKKTHSYKLAISIHTLRLKNRIQASDYDSSYNLYRIKTPTLQQQHLIHTKDQNFNYGN